MTGSQLPDWMRDPATPATTTRRWRWKLWLQSRKPWRAVADRYWRFQSRSGFMQRHPKATAAIFVIVTILLVVGGMMLAAWLAVECGPGPGCPRW